MLKNKLENRFKNELKHKLGVLIATASVIASMPLYSYETSEHEIHKYEMKKSHGDKERNHGWHNSMAFPDVIPVPAGFQPEGVVTGRGHTAYVGSLANGAIYKVDLRTGKGHVFIEGTDNSSAVGLAYDKRSNYIYVAGGLFGHITVYDATDGAMVKKYHVGAEGGFINDGIVTDNAIYFTDSFVPVLYKIPLYDDDELPEESDVEVLSLSGDFEHTPGEFNANGIEATRDGESLFIVNSFSGLLFKVDPITAEAQVVDLGGVLLNSGDGMLMRGRALYVVQNFLNQIAEITLSADGLSGQLTQMITNPNFQIPTTASYFGNALYAINARFDVAPPPLPGFPEADPATTFDLVRVELNK